MEVFAIAGVLAVFTGWLSYRNQVFDYFIYIVSVLSVVLAFVWFAFLRDNTVAIILLSFGILTSGSLFLFRFIKHL